MAGSLDTERSQRGGKGRRYQERAGKDGGGGSGRFYGGYQEVIWRQELEGGRRGASVHVGKSNVAETIYGLRIVQVTQ